MGDGKAHAKLSASGAHRWMNCAASISIEEQAGPRESSDFADEGTAAHNVAEMCLQRNLNADDYAGVFIEVGEKEFEVNDEMVNSVQDYLDHVRSLEGVLVVEQEVSFSDWVPGGFGTADAIVMKENEIHVIDLKYGKGKFVSAFENPQGMLYGLGVISEYGDLFDFDKLVLTIVQPRMDNISEYEISKADLLKFGEKAAQAADLALSQFPPFNPGTEQCFFCAGTGTCEALAKHNMALAVEGFETVTEHGELKDLGVLEEDQIIHILKHISGFKKWANSFEAHAQSRLESGKQLKGYKIVRGKSNRKWRDEDAAAKALTRKLTKKGAYTQKIISPAEAEKRLGKENVIVKKHAFKPEGGLTIAVESDPRPAVSCDPTDGF